MMTRQLLLSIAFSCVATTVATSQCLSNNIGMPLGAGDDTISTVALGFSFTFPDGTVVTSIDIDSNGRIFPPGAALSSSYGNAFTFTNGPTAVAPFWTDMDPSDPLSDDVYFSTDNATTAVVTWQDVVAKFDTEPLTFQAILRSDNTCLLYTSPSPRDRTRSRMPSSA